MSKIRIGLVGVSHRAGIAEAWAKDPRSEIVAGADIVDEFLKEFQDKYGADTYVTNDYAEMVKRDDIDAVAVFTPDNFHAAPTIAALEAGKHVFVEKPMAITVADCDAMLRAEKKSGKKLFVGFNMRYMPAIATMKEIVEAGTIGKVTAAWCRHFVGFGAWAYLHDYRANRKGSTSILLQKASHDIDVIHHITGQYTERVVGMGGLDVYGGDKPNDLECDVCDEADTCPDFSDRPIPTKHHCVYRKEVDVEDHSMLLMRLTNGVRASYQQCLYTPDTWRNHCFIGEAGRIENDEKFNTIRLLTRRASRTRHDHDFNYSEVLYNIGGTEGGHGGADPLMCKAFLDYIIDDIPPRAESLAGRMSVATGCYGAESIRNDNRAIDIPPVDWEGK